MMLPGTPKKNKKEAISSKRQQPLTIQVPADAATTAAATAVANDSSTGGGDIDTKNGAPLSDLNPPQHQLQLQLQNSSSGGGNQTTTTRSRPPFRNLPSSPMDDNNEDEVGYAEVVLSDEDLEGLVGGVSTGAAAAAAAAGEQRGECDDDDDDDGMLPKEETAATTAIEQEQQQQQQQQEEDEGDGLFRADTTITTATGSSRGWVGKLSSAAAVRGRRKSHNSSSSSSSSKAAKAAVTERRRRRRRSGGANNDENNVQEDEREDDDDEEEAAADADDESEILDPSTHDQGVGTVAATGAAALLTDDATSSPTTRRRRKQQQQQRSFGRKKKGHRPRAASADQVLLIPAADKDLDDEEEEEEDDDDENEHDNDEERRFQALLVDDKPWRGGGNRSRKSNKYKQQRQQQQQQQRRSSSVGRPRISSSKSSSSTQAKQHTQILRYIRSLATGGTSRGNKTPDAPNANANITDEQQQLDNDSVTNENTIKHTQQSDKAFLASPPQGQNGEEEDEEDDGYKEDEEGDELLVEEEEEEEEVDVDESSFDSTEQDYIVESDYEWKDEPNNMDWASLPMLPNRFCNTLSPSSAPLLLMNDSNISTYAGGGGGSGGTSSSNITSSTPYLESSMWNAPMTVQEGNCFVWEHGLLLQAVLQLLAEREQVGVEGSVDVADNIWKKGPLKKMAFAMGRRSKRPTAGTWKVKYVELRRGNLCYYEDSGPSSGRKTIHLRQAEATVQESKAYRGPGFVFELLVQGSPAKYWLARSEEERQAWIRAIQSAMIGETNNRYRDLDLTPHQPSIQAYTRLRESIQEADMQELYLDAIEKATQEVESLQVPVEWVLEQKNKEEQDSVSYTRAVVRRPSRQNPAHRQLKNSISEFWKSMQKVSFSINGFVIPNDTALAAQRVVGSLTRCFLEFDKAVVAADDEFATTGSSQYEITELQAVSYARSILDSILRSRERKDLETVVNHLLRGRPELVCVSGQISEEHELESVTRLDVSFPGDDLLDDFDEQDSGDISSWVWFVRRKSSSGPVPNSKWKRRFAVLSGAVLSFYEAASPRPHGLRGQVVLHRDTAVSTKEIEPSKEGSKMGSNERGRYVVRMVTRGTEYLLSFADDTDMTEWKDTLLHTIESTKTAEDSQRENPPAGKTAPAKMLVKGAERVIKGAADGSIRGGIRVIRGAKDSGIKAMKIATDGSMKVLRVAVGRLRSTSGAVRGGRGSPTRNRRSLLKRVPSVQILLEQSTVAGKREPTVQCVVQRARMFSIRSARYGSNKNDLESDDDDEPWISVQATYYQAFLLSGGPSGRLNCGDALVALDFLDFKAEDDLDEGEYVGEIEVL